MFQKIIIIILLILLVIFQLSFLNNLNFFYKYINIIIFVVVYITLIYDEKTGLFIGLTCGIFLDLFSPFIFGLYTISLVASVFFISVLFKKFLARKSTTSLILLTIIFVVLYNFLLCLLSYITYWLDLSNISININGQYFNYLIGNILFNTIFAFIMHNIIKLIKKIIKTRFIIQKI